MFFEVTLMNLDPDHQTLRTLAARWMELACLPVMDERRRLWTSLKDLRPERPMVLFEVWTLENYVRQDELVCTDPELRAVEHNMRETIRQIEELGDDRVIDTAYRLYWDISVNHPDFGVGLKATHADDAQGGQVAYSYNHPIRTLTDVARLKPRTWKVDRQRTLDRQARLQDIFGDLLPVVIHGTGQQHGGITGELFKLIGNDNLLMWTYDAPEALHRVMAYLRTDRVNYYRWLESEGLLGLNNDIEWAGSGSPGFTTALPAPGSSGAVRLKDLWVWIESQETTMISPSMFSRLFLPYMADIASLFGLVYYGCCEPVHDRWQRIMGSIPHVRAVSISPWCDARAMAENVGGQVVLSRKPRPWPISGPQPDWEALEKDVDEMLAAAGSTPLEFIYRDVYRIHEDRPRLRRWVELVRSSIGGQGL
jgi:hypothetical protein